jgi:hypothetical protein
MCERVGEGVLVRQFFGQRRRATIKPVVPGRAGNWAISHQRQQDRCSDAPGVCYSALKEDFNGAIEIVSYVYVK